MMDVGVGAVLSQHLTSDQKLHPCAFFSRRLSAAEQHYDIGNRELLAVKLAQEEWRHWLEGTKIPLLVWTDHRNLEYVRTAKRFNSRQSWWSLFFTRFNFSLSYRAGSLNINPDALSRQEKDAIPGHAPILSAPCMVATLTWEIEERVRSTMEDHPGPSNVPHDHPFGHLALQADVLQWSHPSKLYYHSEIQRTKDVVQQCFGWATLDEDIRGFVYACLICNQHKSSRLAPASFLQPLPVPHCPWSQISLDFVTGLPPFKSNPDCCGPI